MKGSLKDFKHTKPTTARLIVEVSTSSLVYDRNKALDYAKGNVEEYWIVDVENELVEVYTEPTEKGYKAVKILTKKDILSLWEGTIELKSIFD